MKRTISQFGLAIILVWVLNTVPSYGYGGQDTWDDANTKNRSFQQPNRPNRQGQGAKGQRRGPAKQDPRKLMRDITKLQEVMKQRLELSADQVKEIDPLFEAHLQLLRQPTQGRKTGGPDQAAADSSRELREQLAAAREAGDTEAVKGIRDQMRALMGQRGDGTEEATTSFVQKVADQLTKEQKQEFQRIMRRLKLDQYIEKPGAGLRDLMRAVHNQRVNLSDEQKQTIRELTSEAFKGAAGEGKSREMTEEVTAELQARILAELTDEQRATVERLLQSDQSRQGADRRRTGSNRPGRGGGQRRP